MDKVPVKAGLNDLRGRRRKCLLVPALIILTAAAKPSQGDSSLDDLYQIFQVDFPSADIVILLDASRSMLHNNYSDVRQAVTAFITTLSEHETLHLRVFGDAVSSPLEANPPEIAGNIGSYLPIDPFFSHTDLGLAIFKGLEFLERDGASKIQAFLLITDGFHEPPPGSPYSRQFAIDPNWQALKHRALAVCRQRSLLVYGFGLGRQTDIAVLRQVFPARTVEVVVGNPSQIVRTLRSIRERLRRTQLRQAMEQEFRGGLVEVRLETSYLELDVNSFDLTLTIRNGYARLPITIERIEVQRGSGAEEITCVLEGVQAGKRLEPGNHVQARVKGKLLAESPGFRLGRKERSFQALFRFVPVIRLQHQDAFDQFAVDQHGEIETPLLAVHLRERYGAPYWALALIGLALSAVAALSIANVGKRKRRLKEAAQCRRERRRLAGTLRIWLLHEDESNADAIELACLRQQELDLVVAEGGSLEVIATSDQSTLVVAQLHSLASLAAASASERPEFQMASVGRHKLAYESGGEMREAATLTLCDNDLIELDGRWRLRYSNQRFRTRAEFESAEVGGNYDVH